MLPLSLKVKSPHGCTLKPPARQIVLDKVEDEEDEQRHAKVHNSLTTDGVSMPVLPKGKKTIPLSRELTRKKITQVTLSGSGQAWLRL